VHSTLVPLLTTGKEQAALEGDVDRVADNQAEMHASDAPAIDITIPEQWILTSEAPEPCNGREAPRSDAQQKARRGFPAGRDPGVSIS
jgi:hypothetical protein